MHGKLFDVLKNLLFVGLGGNECIDDDFEDKDSLSVLSQVVTDNCGSKVSSLEANMIEPSTTEKAATDEGVKIHEPSTEKVTIESIDDVIEIYKPLPIESSNSGIIDETSRERAAIESINDSVKIDELSSTENVPIESTDDEVIIYGLLPIESSSESVKIDEPSTEKAVIESSSESVKIEEPPLTEKAPIESSSDGVKIDEPSSTEKAPMESIHVKISELSTEKSMIESDTTNETLQYLITIATLETKLAAVENQNIFVRDVCDKLDTQHSLTCAAKTEELRNTVEMNSREISELVKQRRKNVAEINEMKQKIFEQQKKIEFLSKSVKVLPETVTEATKDATVKMIEQMPEETIEEATEPQVQEATEPQFEETTVAIMSIGAELSQSLLPPLEEIVEQEQVET